MLNEIYTKYINKDFSKPIRNENLNVVGYGIYNNSHTEEANKRYFLQISINEKGNKDVIALLMNPARTFPSCGFDRTIINTIKIAKKENYKKLIVLNTFSDIESDSSSAQRNYIEDKSNEEFIHLILNKYKEKFDIFIACGDIISDDLFNKYISQIDCCKNKNKDYLWSFAKLTKKGRPRHVSPHAFYNIKLLKKFMNNEINKQFLKIESGILKEINKEVV